MGYWVSLHRRRLRRAAAAVLLATAACCCSRRRSCWPGCWCPRSRSPAFAWTRRWRYGPFFLLLVLVGVVMMSVGFPEGTPLRRGANFAYNHVEAVQFLRTTYKAGAARGARLAGLGGAAAAAAASALRRRGRWAAPAAAVAGLAFAAVACWPLVRGRALDDQLLWERVPAAWDDAADDLDARPDRPARRRAARPAVRVLRWGGTVDPILPALTDRPVAVRNAVPYADLRGRRPAVDRRRAGAAAPRRPGPARAAARPAGRRHGGDRRRRRRTRSGATPPAEAAARARRARPLRTRPGARCAPSRTPRARSDAARPLPRVRAWRPPGGAAARARRARRARPRSSTAPPPAWRRWRRSARCPTRRARSTPPTCRAADVRRRRRRRRGRDHGLQPAAGATSCRGWRRTRGAVLGAGGPGARGRRRARPVPGPRHRRPDRRRATTARELRPRAVLARLPAVPRAPAVRGRSTATRARPGWRTARWTPDRHWLEVGVRPSARRPVHRRAARTPTPRVHVSAVEVAGRRFDVRAGWNRLELGLRGARALRVRIAAVEQAPGPTARAGCARCACPGCAVRETLRAAGARRARAGRPRPRRAPAQLRVPAHDRRRPVPARPRPRTASSAMLVRDRGDGETGLARTLAPPAARAWTRRRLGERGRRRRRTTCSTGWRARAAPRRFTGSPRFQGRPGIARLERLRRHAAALDRVLDRGPSPRGSSGGARA